MALCICFANALYMRYMVISLELSNNDELDIGNIVLLENLT